MKLIDDLFDLRGKVAAITGGARGIGAETARTLAAAGASVAILDVLSQPAAALVEEIRAQGGYRVLVARRHARGRCGTRVRRDRRALRAPRRAREQRGHRGPQRADARLTLAQWQRVQDVNVNGVFLCTRAAIPHIDAAGGGSIVNLSSMYGIVGRPDVPAYHASKAAVRMMAKVDAMLYAAKNIRANSVHPGYIRTPMLEEAFRQMGQDPDRAFEYMQTNVPMAKIGSPRDIAAGILYLVSPAGRYVTGAGVIDGGFTAR